MKFKITWQGTIHDKPQEETYDSREQAERECAQMIRTAERIREPWIIRPTVSSVAEKATNGLE